MVDFRNFLKLKNILSRLNPIPAFPFGDEEEVIVKSQSQEELLKSVIKKYPQFKRIIMISIYHLINTQNVEKEYLTVLTKDLRLIADLTEWEMDKVSVPKNVKEESKKGNVLVICHNHFHGAIIFSLIDFKNVLCSKIKFSVIVSNGNIGILVNEFSSFDEKYLKSLKIELKDYIGYVMFTFIINNDEAIEKLDNSNLDDELYSIEYQNLFDWFIAKNNLKFIDEFNLRMKKYNLYYLYINF